MQVYIQIEYERRNEAIILSIQAINDIENKLVLFYKSPKMIFCSKQDNYENLGFKKSAARTIGPLGIVIGPRAWKDYFIKHELIHF